MEPAGDWKSGPVQCQLTSEAIDRIVTSVLLRRDVIHNSDIGGIAAAADALLQPARKRLRQGFALAAANDDELRRLARG